tara:strand:+ start:205 stop:2595 length:2391 start_codon:yes stop_codon:yes gene_type:complete
MSYILQNNSGLIAVRLTDAGRKKLSQGNLSLSLFQLGDSEFCYDCYTEVLTNDSGIFVTEPKWNAQNISNVSAERNKQNVKYPVPVLETNEGATYGVLTPSHSEQAVFNKARPRGFFNYNTTGSTIYGDSAYALSSTWCWPMSNTNGGNVMSLTSGSTCGTQTYWPQAGDVIMVQQLSPYMVSTPDCDSGNVVIPLNQPMPYLFYNVMSATTSGSSTVSIVVDRNLPNWAALNINSASTSTDCSRVVIYPGGHVTSYWGQNTPIPYWSPGSLSFDNNCDVSVADVNVWNMNINWTQWDGNSINMGTMAGINNNVYEDVNRYGSSGYCSTKEYLGYNSDSGQFDTTNMQDQYGLNDVPGYEKESSGTYIRDSFGAVRTVTPSEQRMVAILHFTNYTISNFYGEKFALEPDGTVLNGIGEMDNFKVHMPHIMWHRKKSTGTGMGDECEMGQTFYIDPPGFSVAEEQYVESTPNPDMNEPGIRYYHLWDDNVAVRARSAGDNVPNRVGKVFPDLQIIVIDDQELITAMSHKSNRNWTLPMPKLELVPAGTSCDTVDTAGVFNGTTNTEELYFTYLMGNTSGYTTGLHCNYYNRILGDTSAGARDIKINFGSEWPYLRDLNSSICSYSGTGWNANSVHLLFQKVPYGTYPDPAAWKIFNATNQVSTGTTLTSSNMSKSVGGFYIDNTVYGAATTYNLHNHINIPLNNGQESNLLQFGDENFFFGNIETDIMATIYEMKYNVTVSNTQFSTSTNPTWNTGDKVRITEIGLYDSTKDLMAIAKLRTPVKRQGTQTFVIKIDY